MDEEEPQQQYHGIQQDESGWKLYYSEEGYPYYYNEITGDSRWAEYDQTTTTSDYQQNNEKPIETTTSQENHQYSPQKNQGKVNDPRFYSGSRYNAMNEEPRKMRTFTEETRKINHITRRDEEENVDREEDLEEGDDSEEEESEEEESSEDNEDFDRKFREYLRTPEGIAAVLYEQERIERIVREKEEKQNFQRDAEYVQTLLESKKSDGDIKSKRNNKTRVINKPMNIFETIREGFNVHLKGLIDPAERADKAERKLKKKIEEKERAGKEGKTSSDQTTTKQRRNRESKTENHHERDIEDPSEGEERSGASRSGSSSDLVSLSSDDSDVELINAPILSEVTPYLNRFYDSYIQPTRQYLEQSGIAESTAATANLVFVGGRYVVYNLATATFSIATGLFSIGGTLLQSGVAATGRQLYPHLVSFMENIIDGGNTSHPHQLLTPPAVEKKEENTTGDIHYTSSNQIQEENIFIPDVPIVKEETVATTTVVPSTTEAGLNSTLSISTEV